MSLYNMMHGVNLISFYVLPMLELHPDNDIPRFRNVFLSDDEHPEYDNFIHIYTRVGGGNRGTGFGEEKLMEHSEFVTTWDDSFDSTFGTYLFKVPEKWKVDFDNIINGNLHNVSIEYRNQMKKVFPKLTEKIDEIFKLAEERQSERSNKK